MAGLARRTEATEQQLAALGNQGHNERFCLSPKSMSTASKGGCGRVFGELQCRDDYSF